MGTKYCGRIYKWTILILKKRSGKGTEELQKPNLLRVGGGGERAFQSDRRA